MWSYDITHGVHVYRFNNFNQLTRIRETVKCIMPLEATPQSYILISTFKSTLLEHKLVNNDPYYIA